MVSIPVGFDPGFDGDVLLRLREVAVELEKLRLLIVATENAVLMKQLTAVVGPLALVQIELELAAQVNTKRVNTEN